MKRLHSAATAAVHALRTGVPQVEENAPLATSAIHGNLLSTLGGTWAWFVISDQDYYFRDFAVRDSVRTEQAARFTGLVGYRIHLRGTEHPFAHPTWARSYLNRTASRRLPDPPQGETFRDMVGAMERRTAGGRAADGAKVAPMMVPTTYLGVRLTTDSFTRDELTALRAGTPVTSRRLEEAAQALREVADEVRGEGLRGRPMTGRALANLICASLTPGLPVTASSLEAATAGWDESTIEEFTAPVRWTAPPYAPAVRITATRGKTLRTLHASVASLARVPARSSTDSRLPLFAWMRTLEFPVQWSAVLDIVDGALLKERATKVRRNVDDQIEHTAEAGGKPERRTLRLRDEAARVEDDRSSPLPDVRCRLVGQIRVLVTGDTEPEALDRRTTFIKRAVTDQGAVFAEHPGQWATAREFVPGEPPAEEGFVRPIPAQLFGAFGIAVKSKVLDHRGPYRGYTTRTSGRPFHFHPQDGPEHGRSGLQLIIATLGAGKSYVGAGTFELAVREGQHCGALDPAGKMRDLLRLEHLAGRVRDMDLAHAANGLFVPWRQVPEPQAATFLPSRTKFPAGHDGSAAYEAAVAVAVTRYEQAVQAASEERRSLAVELFMSRLPAQVAEDNPSARLVIRSAVNEVGGDYDTDPWSAVDAMTRDGADGPVFARMIGESAAGLGGRLVLPPRGWRDPATDVLSDNIIITARNLPLPAPGVPRRQWTEGEQFAAGLTRAASWYLTRMMYGSGQTPKFINLEEAGDIGGDESIRGLAARASLHTRKSNTALLLAVQNPLKIEQIDPEIGNLVGTTFIGRMGTLAAAESALRLAGVPQMYAPVLLKLAVGEFLIRDHNGDVATAAFDGEYRPHVHEVLRTNPAATGGDIDATGIDDPTQALEFVQ